MEYRAGRELDALVAEKVMGWRWIANAKGGFLLVPPEQHTKMLPAYVFENKNGSLDHRKLGHYSTSIEAAWGVVEKLRQKYCCIKVYSDHAYIYECTIVKDPDDDHDAPIIFEQAETAPLAICLAALKAVGAEGEGLQ